MSGGDRMAVGGDACYHTLMISPGHSISSSQEPSRHMNTSLVRVDFRGVVGMPWGHLDSSSKVTIFSRGFGIVIIVELPA